jgi:hypothetical protein
LVHVTGPNANLSVFLVKREESNHTLYEIDNITLNPEYPSFNTTSGKYLFGNTLEKGGYTVFINTTNLNAGYYELRCERQVYEKKTYGARGFYLADSSQPSHVEEVNTK